MKRIFASLQITLLLASLSFAQGTRESETFALKPNDTVVFYGDSITDQRMYTMLTELYVVTRYPKLKVQFVHSGWGGDRVTGGGGGNIEVRLARDVVAYHPTVMTIMLGMNDGNYANHKEVDDTVYYNGYRHIVESVGKALPGLRVTAIGPSPYDDVTRPLMLQPDGYNAVLVGYSDFAKKYAAENKLNYSDFNAPVVAMLRKANSKDPGLAQKIIPDRVHPGWAGHLVMAEQLVKSWNGRSLVSQVWIDAKERRVTESKFARISELHPTGNLKWTQTDEALPLPFANLVASDNEKTIQLAIESSDVAEALNQQPLKVTGLSVGKYKLSIDQEAIGTFTEGELATGINLAVLSTPMSKQAMAVRDFTVKRIEVHQQRWRTLQVPMALLELPHLDDALKALDTLDKELTEKQHMAAQPMAHDFELTSLEQ